MSHTPTPWKIMRSTVYALDETGTCNRFSCRPEGGWEVNGKHYTKLAEVEANARLIAAAPALYEALELADATLRGANMNRDVVERKVSAALALARGDA